MTSRHLLGENMLILVGGQKGGTGKSTVSTNLAAMRVTQERDVLLYDLDPQRTSTLWASRRDENQVSPRIDSTQKVLDKRVLNTGLVIRNELLSLIPRYQDIIIDAGGADNEILRATMTLANTFILPLMTSSFDIWTLDLMNNLVSEATQINSKLTAKVLYNKVATQPSTAKKEIAESDEILQDFVVLKRFTTTMVYRVAVRRSQSKGLSVSEYKPSDDKAIEEVNALYEEVFNDK
jgi:chromosome partitioning protein